MMRNIPSSSPSSVPSIHILTADDTSPLIEPGWFTPDVCNTMYDPQEGTGMFFPMLQSEFLPQNVSTELDEMSELTHLSTPGLFLTGSGYSTPYGIMQDNGAMTATDGLSPSSLGSSAASPSSSFVGSLSPSSLYESSALSDTETPLSPLPATPDDEFYRYLPSVPVFPNDFPDSLDSQCGPHRPRSHSAPSSHRTAVASKAMLEANGRRRRHPAQFTCEECKQTFTALFSLKRHAQSHTGERPFACKIPGCDQRFFNSSDCKRHEKSKKRHKDLLSQ